MSNKFDITISATDKATAVFRKVNAAMSKAFRPVARAQKTLGSLAREMHLDKITKGMRGLSAASMKVASSMGLAAGPMEAIFGLGAAGGIVAAGAAIVGLGARFGNLGFEVARTSRTIGVSTNDLQAYRGAAKLAGLSQDDLTNSFAALGTTLQDAQFGRNPQAYTILNKFGIGIKRNKEGVVDTVETFKELSRVISQVADPHVQEIIANAFGVGAMLPLLRQGPAAVEALTAKAKEFGLVASGDALNGATKFGDSLNRLKAAIEGVANTWGQKLTPLLTRGLDSILSTGSKAGGISFADIFGFGGNSASWRAASSMLGGGAASGMQRSSGTVTGAPGVGTGSLPLGLRQNNPGNLRAWGSNPRENGFARFGTAQDGLNAMAQQIGLYGNRDGLRSISGIVSKYAPSSENNTAAYINDVSKATGFDPNAQLNTNDPKVLAPLLSAMVKKEQGRQPFTADQYAQAAQTVKVEVAFANAPAGTQAKASNGGTSMPARVSYALPMGDAP